MIRPLAFCATGRTGLGHLRRVTTIAESIRRRDEGHRDGVRPLTLLTNAAPGPIAGDWTRTFDHVQHLDRSEMGNHLAERHDWTAVVVDTAIVPGIERVDAPLCLVLREVKEARLESFRLAGGRPWDLVVVPNSPDEWRPPVDAGFARRIECVGWVYRGSATSGSSPTSTSRTDGTSRVLIALGGGGTPVTRALLRETLAPVIDAVRDTGTTEIIQVRSSSGVEVLSGVHRELPPTPNLPDLFGDSDVVISTAGYNSVLELAAMDVPVLLVPIPRTLDDQDARARRWADALGLDHRAAEPERSAAWIRDVLARRRRRAPVSLGPSGADRCAELLTRDHRSGRGVIDSSRWFVKPLPPDRLTLGPRLVARSIALRAFGVRTPSARFDADARAMCFPHIHGQGGREALAVALDAARQTGTDVPLRTFLGAAIGALARLHAVPTTTVGVDPLDPLRRVRPRLEPSAATPPPEIRQLIERAHRAHDTLRTRLGLLTPPRLAPDVVVHGDFHVGQLIFGAEDAEPWLVDLDDLARGAPESDLGNFLAHLSTSDACTDTAVLTVFEQLEAIVSASYTRVAEVPPDPDLLRLYASIALLRRSLKFVETGQGPPRIDAALSASERLAELLA